MNPAINEIEGAMCLERKAIPKTLSQIKKLKINPVAE